MSITWTEGAQPWPLTGASRMRVRWWRSTTSSCSATWTPATRTTAGDELLAVVADGRTAVFFCIGPVATPHVRLEQWDAAPDFAEDDWPERQEVELTLVAERVGLSSLSGAGIGFEFDVEEPGRYVVRAARTTITPADVAAAAVDAGLGEPASERWLVQVWPTATA